MKTLPLCLPLALCLTLCASAWAATPSVESCQKLGHIDAYCFDCRTKEFLGKVSVPARYDPDFGDCMDSTKEAHTKCVRAYSSKDHPGEHMGADWDYWFGVTHFFGNYPTGCKR